MNRSALAVLAALFVVGCSGTAGGPDSGDTGGGSGGGMAAGGGTGGGTAGGTGGGTAGGTGGGTAGGSGGGTGGGTAGGSGGGGAGGGSGGGGSSDGGVDDLPDPTVTGNVLHVCPTGCTYSKPSLAFAAAVNGDTIQIDQGDYIDCGTISKDNVIVRGVLNGTQRPKVHSMVCGRKGIFIVTGSNVLIENLELYDAVDPTTNDKNWAGVRWDTVTTSFNLKLRNLYIHDADDGVLGRNTISGPNGLVIEDSLFEKLGRSGYAHGMYIGDGVTFFVLRRSVVKSNHDDGHLVKSRALRNIIHCNTIAGLDGLNSYGVDLPQGGTAVLSNNVIEHGPHVQNGTNAMVNFAEENGNNAPHALQLVSNYFVNDFTAQGRVNVARPADTSGWSSNTYVGPGGSMLLVGADAGAGGSFTNFASRTTAGLGAYDGGLGSLPPLTGCP